MSRYFLMIIVLLIIGGCNLYTPYYVKKQQEKLAQLEAEYDVAQAELHTLEVSKENLHKRKEARFRALILRSEIIGVQANIANPDKL